MKQFLRIFIFLKPYKWRFIGALFLGVLYSTANVYFTTCSDLIDEIANKRIDNLTNQVFNAIVLYGIRTLTQFTTILILKLAYICPSTLKPTYIKKCKTKAKHFIQN